MARSFAFDVAQPAQRNASGAGTDAPRIDVQGGNNQSQGGVVGGFNATEAQGGDTAIPQFLEEAFRPQIEARQQAKLVAGATAVFQGATIKDIKDQQPGWANIFGPNYFTQGAQFQTAVTKVKTATGGILADMDNVKQMDKDSFDKLLATTSQAVLTGDGATDTIIQKEYLASIADLTQKYTVARYGWQQEKADEAEAQQFDASMGLYQQQAVLSAASPLSSPDLDHIRENGFNTAFDITPGRDPERYQASLTNMTMRAIKNGQFYSVHQFYAAGLDRRLTTAQQTQLTSAMDAGQRAAIPDALHDQIPALLEIKADQEKFHDYVTADETEQAQMRANGYIPVSPAELVNKAEAINASVKKATGIDMDALDTNKVLDIGNNVIDSLGAGSAAARARREANRQRELTRAETLADKQAEANENAKYAQLGWAAGDIGTYKLSGKTDANGVTHAWVNAVDAQDFEGIARNFENGNAPDEAAARRAQAPIASANGKGIGITLKNKVMPFYEKLNARSNGAAQALYGPLYTKLATVSQMVAGGAAEEEAYLAAFSDSAYGKRPDVPGFLKGEKPQKMLAGVVDKIKPTTGLFSGDRSWNDGSKQTVIAALTDGVAGTMDISNQSDENIAKAAYNVAKANGSLEGYGPFMWRQFPKSTNLAKTYLGGNEQAFARVLYDQVDKEFKAQGVPEGASAKAYDIVRTDTASGPVLTFMLNKDGKVHVAHVTMPMITSAAKVKAQNTINSAQGRRDGVDWLLHGDGKPVDFLGRTGDALQHQNEVDDKNAETTRKVAKDIVDTVTTPSSYALPKG